MKQIKNTGLYLVPVLVSNGFPLVTLPIFTRFLSPEDYGVWALAQVYAIFLTGIANFGLVIGYERNFFERREARQAAGLLYATLGFVGAALLLLGGLTYIFRHELARVVIGSEDHSGVLFWSYCATGMVGLKNYYLTYFKNTENARAYVWYTIDETLLSVLLSLGLVAGLGCGVMGLVWGQLAASSVVTCALTLRFFRVLPVCFDWQALVGALRISVPLTPRIFFGVIGTQFDKYMLGLMNTLGGAGIYSLAQKIANAVFTCMTAIQNVYSPQVYRRMFSKHAEEGRSIGPYLTPFLYVSAFFGLVVALFAEEILGMLTPPEFHSGANVVTLLSLLYVTYFFGKQPQLIYAKKTFLTSILTLGGIGLNIAINIPFIQRWGVIGAAWGALASGLIMGGISFLVGQRYYRIHWEYGKVALVLFLLFGSGLVLILLREADVPYGMRAGVKLVSLCAYAYLGMRLDIVGRKNWSLVKGMLFAVPCGAGRSRKPCLDPSEAQLTRDNGRPN